MSTLILHQSRREQIPTLDQGTVRGGSTATRQPCMCTAMHILFRPAPSISHWAQGRVITQHADTNHQNSHFYILGHVPISLKEGQQKGQKLSSSPPYHTIDHCSCLLPKVCRVEGNNAKSSSNHTCTQHSASKHYLYDHDGPLHGHYHQHRLRQCYGADRLSRHLDREMVDG